MTKLTSGSTYLLDGKTEVIVLKPSSRSNLSYAVEIPGKSIEVVSSDRLSELSASTKPVITPEIFEYDE